MSTQGKRIYTEGDGYPELEEPGTYGKTVNGWYCCSPNGMLGNLNSHSVTEHKDGTITVSPSILITENLPTGNIQWHGFLERGVWREA